VLTEALAAGGDEAKRAFDAMMGMKKIDGLFTLAARLVLSPISYHFSCGAISVPFVAQRY
jgi:hypothetical protein